MSEISDTCACLCNADSRTLRLLIGEIARILRQRGQRHEPEEATQLRTALQNNVVTEQLASTQGE